MKASRPGRSEPVVARYALGTLLAFGALNAFGGGLYGMLGAPSVPREWLRQTLFRGYFIPGLILFTIVGGTLVVGAVAVFARLRMERAAVINAAVVLLIWIATQVSSIGYVSWLQPITAAAGVLILVLAAALPSHGDF